MAVQGEGPDSGLESGVVKNRLQELGEQELAAEHSRRHRRDVLRGRLSP
ncbi:hypothetical protein ABH922_001775 [Rhodococcus sp. 27YEA15]